MLKDWDVIIQLNECTIEGKDLSYVMSDKFLQYFLGNRYPESIQVQGKKLLTFHYLGMSATAHNYRNGEFNLKIKYN